MDSQDIIASAERLVAELWEAKKAEAAVEEPAQDAPPCPEAAEDEVAEIEQFVKVWVAINDEEAVETTVAAILKHGDGPIAVYIAHIFRRFYCSDKRCSRLHGNTANLTVLKQGKVFSVLEPSVILDRQQQILEAIQAEQKSNGAVMVQFDLADMIEQSTAKAVRAEIERMIAGPDDDDLPPAASVGPDDDDDGLPPAAVAGPDDDDLPPAAIVAEEAKSTPVAVAEYRVMPWNEEEDDDQPSLLRRLCNRLRRR